MFDPNTFPLEADLSRADVRVLYKYGCDKNVIEFGCGGSTVLLSLFVKSVVSYDTSPDWIARAKRRLEKEAAHNCKGIHLCGRSVPPNLPKADVYFVDGLDALRAPWAAAAVDRELAPVVIIHDSRRALTMNAIAAVLIHPRTLKISSVDYHADESNMIVIHTRPALKYENWNLTEPENRLPALPVVR